MDIALIAMTRGGVSGGFRKYLREFVPVLRGQPEVGRVQVFVPASIAETGDLTWPLDDERRGYRQLRRLVAAGRPDVVFIPTARMLRVGATPIVTMVRNVEPLEVPFEGNRPAEALKNVVRAWAARDSCRRSDRVIAVSQHVHDLIVARWRVPAERIGVVPHGHDRTANLSAPRLVLAAVAGGPFLFTAGSIRPARGLEDVVAALAVLPPRVKLVVAGRVDDGAAHYDRFIRRLAVDAGVYSRIVWAGHLGRDAMSWCFRHAEFFVMTSRAESCPNIAIEAMAEGAASVSTDHPPMPEFLGDAAWYYRARDARHLGQRLSEALAAPATVQRGLRERARQRAEAFTWDATARGTVAELRHAIDRCASCT